MMARWTAGGPSFDRLGSTAHRNERGLVDILLVIGVMALLSLSGYALEFFGIPYESTGGSIVTKIHPATYLFAVALALAVIANPNPLGYGLSLLLRCLGSVFLLVGCLLLWVFISRYKPDWPASFLIDALMGAALIFLLFADAGERTRLVAARTVHVIMALNCVLAIVEGLSDWRLFPFIISGREQTWEYRATALLGHPLGGALATGVYAVILMTVNKVRGLSKRWRLPLVLLCMAAMPFIGARTSFAIVYATAVGVVGLEALRFLRGGTLRVGTLLRLMVLGGLGAVAIVVMFQIGVFDNFLNRFGNDSGSAETRLLLFRLFEGLDLIDVLIGQSRDSLDTDVRLNGLSEGIESTWPGHFLRYGLVMSVVLWFGIAGWFVDMARAGGRGAILPLAFVLLVISTSVGVSGKTIMLTVPAVLILVLIARAPDTRQPALVEDDDLLSRIRTRLQA